MNRNTATDTAGIDPELIRVISRLDFDQQLEVKGYLKGLITRSMVEGKPSKKPCQVLSFSAHKKEV